MDIYTVSQKKWRCQAYVSVCVKSLLIFKILSLVDTSVMICSKVITKDPATP